MQIHLSNPMKAVLEKVHNKPRQQKTPKSLPVDPEGSNHEDGRHTAGTWRDGIPKQMQQLFSCKKERGASCSNVGMSTTNPNPIAIPLYTC